MIDFLNSNQSFDDESGSVGGALLGDATAKLIQRRLNSLLNTEFSGMDTISRLSDLGITRDVNGKLEMATATLTGTDRIGLQRSGPIFHPDNRRESRALAFAWQTSWKPCSILLTAL